METEERTKFRVFKANIKDDNGNKVLSGEVVALSPRLAKHYNKLGYLRPYFEEDESEDAELTGSEREPVRSSRSRVRRAPVTGSDTL